MTQIDIFYQGEDLDDIQHLELEDAATIGDFKKLISKSLGSTGDIHVFIEDAADPSSDDACLADLGNPAGLKLHFHRQRRIEVCVTYNGEDEGRWFRNADLTDRIYAGHTLPIETSTCRNFTTISSGLGLLVAIYGPPFPNHRGGPLLWGSLRVILINNLT